MIEVEHILDLADRIAQSFRPERILLFGSYAYGTPADDSDVDLLVVMQHAGKDHRQATAIRTRTDPSFPVDLLVRTPLVLQQRVALNDFFLKEISEKGVVLYDAIDSRMGREGRRRLRGRAVAVGGGQESRVRSSASRNT